MFTGIIETTGVVQQLQPAAGGGLVVWIDAPGLDFSDVKLGDSIASNGVCLTVTARQGHAYRADISAETISKTLYAQYKPGQRINIEKAMLPTTRFGGHMVSGHVDGIAVVKQVEKTGNSWQVHMTPPAELAKYIAHKGSVTIDGISLTVNELTSDGFRLTIVPHTAQETTIADLKSGARVHIEVDLIARYLERLLQAPTTHSNTGVNLELLAKSGFL